MVDAALYLQSCPRSIYLQTVSRKHTFFFYISNQRLKIKFVKRTQLLIYRRLLGVHCGAFSPTSMSLYCSGFTVKRLKRPQVAC